MGKTVRDLQNILGQVPKDEVHANCKVANDSMRCCLNIRKTLWFKESRKDV